MPDTQYPMPRVIFRMFDYTDAPEVGDNSPTWLNVACLLIVSSLCTWEGPQITAFHILSYTQTMYNIHHISNHLTVITSPQRGQIPSPANFSSSYNKLCLPFVILFIKVVFDSTKPLASDGLLLEAFKKNCFS